MAQQSANFSRPEAQEVVQNILQSTGGDIDAIYCQNDEMALEHPLHCRQRARRLARMYSSVGVDGMKEALDAIKNGTLSATVTCNPRLLPTLFDTIEKAMNGEEIDTFIPVEDKVIDKTNVDEYYEYGF